ncbi:MAG: Nif11-like leader peptide family natural product precursor [Treponema sp.]|nr:Nif11-like leader peptide family natural product precursor [Treponema sp.]
MAKENVKKFFEEVSKNADLQKQLKAATEKNEAEIAKAVKAQAEAVVSVAKGAGFDFTADEFLTAGAPKDSKLDMNELDAVAGGKRAGAGCFIIGVGWGGASVGGGGNACYVIGIGGGITWEAT